MDYIRSVRFIFEHEKWWQLALIGGLAMLVPIVGAVVFMGYLAQMMEHFHISRKDAYEMFNFDKLGSYLTRGLWPFLATLILGLGAVPVFLVLFAVLVGIPTGVLGEDAAPLFLILFVIVTIIVAAVLALATLPITLGAALGQNLRTAFSVSFIRDFVRAVWVEGIITFVFLIVVGIVADIIGLLACGIGIYCTISLVMVCQWHLYWQLYELYLGRGGSAIPLGSGDVRP